MSKNNNDNKKKKIRIPEQVKMFIQSKKKFKKEHDWYDDEDDLDKEYRLFLIDLLPETINFIVRYGYINDPKVQETKAAVFEKINKPKMIKAIKKEMKKGNDVENIELMPIILSEMMTEIKKVNDASLASDPNAKLIDMSDIIDLSQIILSKKMKKFEKAGLSETLAFDILSVIPDDSIISTSHFYRISLFYNRLYEHAKTEEIDFSKVMKIVSSKKNYEKFLIFALLERKEKFSKLTDNQRKLYLSISEWCFSTLEDFDNEKIRELLEVYIAARKKDAANGRDGNRRYALSTLSETEYPHIKKVVTKLIAKDNDNERYL